MNVRSWIDELLRLDPKANLQFQIMDEDGKCHPAYTMGFLGSDPPTIVVGKRTPHLDTPPRKYL